jgi:rSAM/selenodomain-associated transferase 2
MLSVIVPVLNEAANLVETLQAIQAVLPVEAPIEIIVVDGGSQDATVELARSELARSRSVQVISSPPGRAKQMNAGAAIAQGEVLLFVHGDTRLPKGYNCWVEALLAQPGVIAGAFELAIDGSEPGLRWVEWGVNWRSRLCQLPYGDQALFLTAQTFHELGGFPELPIMEDFVFIQKLKGMGKVAIAPTPVVTSSRRWQKLGILQTTAINQIILLSYFLGVAPAQLAQWYRRLKR